METKVKTEDKKILERMAEKLLETQKELDELTIQLTLGKAKAMDKFEDVKLEFKEKVDVLKQFLEKESVKDFFSNFKEKIDQLEKQLSLGKAESKELFEEQKERILKSLTELEEVLKNKINQFKEPHYFSHEVEKFKLKMEILKLKFELKNFEIKDGFISGMADVKKIINNMVVQGKKKFKGGKGKYDEFKDEIALAYKHLKKAIHEL